MFCKNVSYRKIGNDGIQSKSPSLLFSLSVDNQNKCVFPHHKPEVIKTGDSEI